MRTIALAVLMYGALASCPDTTGAAPLAAFRPAKERFTLHEPIYVEFTVENTEDREIKIDLGKNRKGCFLFDVVGPDGTQHNNLRLQDWGAGSAGVTSVAPGETYRQQVLLNEWFTFTEAGDYNVLGRVDGGSPSSLLIRIEPRDEKTLHLVCRDLVQRILQAEGYRQDEVTRGLSYVEDPVAIPYIASILHASIPSQYLLVRTLQRIGTPDAVEVLISALKSRDEDVRKLARNTLSRMAEQTTHEAARDRIRSALRGDP